MCLIVEHAHTLQKVAALELELALLKNKPKLLSSGTIDINLMSSILLDKLEEMGDDRAELYLADNDCKVFNKQEVMDFLVLDETDKIVYVPETMDCDNFAALLYGKGLPLLWTNKHALQWFVDDADNFLWFVESQSDKIARNLDNWQGWDVRMFLNS